MVKLAAKYADKDESEVEFRWRLASAAAHGRYWFLGETHFTHVGVEYEPAYGRTMLEPDPDAVTDVVDSAVDITTRAAFRYVQGIGLDLGQCLDETMKRVAATILLKPGVELPEKFRPHAAS